MKKSILLCLMFLLIGYVNTLCLNNKVLIIGERSISTSLTKFYDKQIDCSDNMPLNIDEYDALFISTNNIYFYISNSSRLIQYLESGKKLYIKCVSGHFKDKTPFWDYVGVSGMSNLPSSYRADSIFGVPGTFAEEIKVPTSVCGDPISQLFWHRESLGGVLYPVLEAKDKMSELGLKLAWAREIDSAKIVIHLQSDENEIDPFLARVICNYFGLCDSVSVGGINQSTYLYPLKIHIIPNPFSQSAIIKYTIHNPAFVRINIYNIIGNKISTIVNEYQDIGEHQAIFNAENYPSGIYYYTIQIGEQIENGKLLLIR